MTTFVTSCTKCATPVNPPYFYDRNGRLVCFDCLLEDKPEVTVTAVERVPGLGAWRPDDELLGLTFKERRKR